MNQLLWEGRLKSGETVGIYRLPSSSKNCMVLQAKTKKGVNANRWIVERKPGVYHLESDHTQFDMATQQEKTRVDHPGEGIGSRLIAFALKEVCGKGGKQVHLQSIENRRWTRHLIEKLGAQRTNDNPTLADVAWKEEQLTLGPRQPWHQFLE